MIKECNFIELWHYEFIKRNQLSDFQIAIAPTYTITNDKAKNSTSKQINKIADNRKTEINDKTEWIGFLELITKNAKKTRKIRTTYIKKDIC